MEIFEAIRQNVGNRILVKKNAGRKRSTFYSNINLIKNIGIVWDSSNPAEFSFISGFYQKLCDRNINMKVIGYYPDKILPDKYTAIRYLSCIRREEVNFFYIPVTTEALEFIDFTFDILIDINFKKVLPLYYISSLSHAKFKIGLFDKDDISPPFDLMMDIQRPVIVENYLNAIIHYLEMIKSGETNNIERF
jgi:hypothetical protein